MYCLAVSTLVNREIDAKNWSSDEPEFNIDLVLTYKTKSNVGANENQSNVDNLKRMLENEHLKVKVKETIPIKAN